MSYLLAIGNLNQSSCHGSNTFCNYIKQSKHRRIWNVYVLYDISYNFLWCRILQDNWAIDLIYWNAVSKDSYLHWDNVFFCLFNLFVSKGNSGMRVCVETDQIFQTVIFIIRWIFVGWRQSRTLYIICKHLLRLISAFEKIIYTHKYINLYNHILRYK